MARNYPADFRLQSFFTENYDRETLARINFYNAQRRGESTSAGRRQKGVPNGLPIINPMQFARRKKLEEDESMRKIVEDARKKFNADVEMYPATRKVKSTLYDGFTKEEKGRYKYLRLRHQENPENKFTYPVTSALEYGWKIQDEDLRRSKFAVSNVTKYSFFTRNGVPDLAAPTNPSQNHSTAAVMY